MNPDTEKAKEILIEGKYTCVICRGEDTDTFTERGVKPLLSLLDSGKSLKGYSAADKVVGRASAFIYTLLKVNEVYAPVMSAGAEKVLRESEISVYYDELVEKIINRQGTGICPMEDAVSLSNTAEDAVEKIRRRLSELPG